MLGLKKKGYCSLCIGGCYSRLQLAKHLETDHKRQRSRLNFASRNSEPSDDEDEADGSEDEADGSDSGTRFNEVRSFMCEASSIEPYLNDNAEAVNVQEVEEEDVDPPDAVAGGSDNADDDWTDGAWMRSFSSNPNSDSSSDSDSVGFGDVPRLFDEADDGQRARALLLLGKRHGLSQAQIKGMFVAFSACLRMGRSSAIALTKRIDTEGAKASSGRGDSTVVSYGGNCVPFVGERKILDYLRRLFKLAAASSQDERPVVRVVQQDVAPPGHRSFFGGPLASEFFDSFVEHGKVEDIPVAATVWFDGTGAWSRRNVTFEHVRIQILNFLDVRGYPINIPISFFSLPKAAKHSTKDASAKALLTRNIIFDLLRRVFRVLSSPTSGFFFKFFGFKLDGFAAVQVLGVRGRFFPRFPVTGGDVGREELLLRASAALSGELEPHTWGLERPDEAFATPRSANEPIWPFLAEFLRPTVLPSLGCNPGAAFLFPPDIMHLLDLNLVPLCVRLCVFRLLAGLLGADGYETIGSVLTAKLEAGAATAALTRRSIQTLVDDINSIIYNVSRRCLGDALPAAYVRGGGELIEQLKRGLDGSGAALEADALENLTWSILPTVVTLQASQCRTLLVAFGVVLARLDGNCHFSVSMANTAEFNSAVVKCNSLFGSLFALYQSVYCTESSGNLDRRCSRLVSCAKEFLENLGNLDSKSAALARFSKAVNFEIFLGLPSALKHWGNLLACSTVLEENANGKVKKEARSSSHALARNGVGIFLEMKKNFELELSASEVLRGLLIEIAGDLMRAHVRHWVPDDLIREASCAAAFAPSTSSAQSLSALGALPGRGVIAPHFPLKHTLKCFLKYLPVAENPKEVMIYTRFIFGGRRTRTRWDQLTFHPRRCDEIGSQAKEFDFDEDDPLKAEFRQRPFALAFRDSVRGACVVELLGALRLPSHSDHIIYLWAVYGAMVGLGAENAPEPDWEDCNGALVVEPEGTTHGALRSTSLAMTTTAPPGVLPHAQRPFDKIVPAVALALSRAKRAPPRVLVKQLCCKLDSIEEILLIDTLEEQKEIFGEILENDASASAFQAAEKAGEL